MPRTKIVSCRTYKYVVLKVETKEILTCDNLQTLYKAIRRDMRYAPTEQLTALFYKDLEDWSFSKAFPFFKMEHLGME